MKKKVAKEVAKKTVQPRKKFGEQLKNTFCGEKLGKPFAGKVE